jgi:hypothetical protein
MDKGLIRFLPSWTVSLRDTTDSPSHLVIYVVTTVTSSQLSHIQNSKGKNNTEKVG